MRRHLLHRVAGTFFPRYSLRLDQINANAALQDWLDQHPMPVFPDRPALHRHVNSLVPDEPVDYLEFGVYEGETMLLWSELNGNPASRFVGFDSFEGLPEDWHPGCKAGRFDVGGKIPEIVDARVSFVKGWFNDTLDPFLATFSPRARLVIHNDSDLYSSSLYLLTKLDKLAVAGTIIIFDELYSALHEFRAMRDYCSAYRRSLVPLGRVDDEHGRVAFLYK